LFYGAVNKCGSAKVTTPSLRATPPWEGNFSATAKIGMGFKIPLPRRGARRAGWLPLPMYIKPQKFATPFVLWLLALEGKIRYTSTLLKNTKYGLGANDAYI